MQSELDLIERAKDEIVADYQAGIIPDTISRFSELHDFVDANYYGGFCDDNATTDYDLIARVQSAVNKWLATREWHDYLSEGN